MGDPVEATEVLRDAVANAYNENLTKEDVILIVIEAAYTWRVTTPKPE